MSQPLLYDSLNEQQKQAVTITDRNVRIVAGAGSGKTRVLMARIEYLIRKERVFPNKILAITFTNKAAREMRQRLDAQMGADAYQVRISTIHSLCARILREDGDYLGYPRTFDILDGDDQRAILKNLYKEMALDQKYYPYGTVLSHISKWKTRGISAQEAADQAVERTARVAAQVYPKYQEHLQSLKAMDFDDLLIYARDLLQENEDVRAKWHRRLDYLHVDEFQDVDPIQYEIIRHLTGPDAFLCVVGDPDQTIYTWRGAAINIILNFDQDFKPCHTVLLTQNYRSTAKILNAANAVIANNTARIKKDLFTASSEGSPIEISNLDDDDAEADFVSASIHNDHKISGIPYEQIAILYRSNFSSRSFEKSLRNQGIPYQVYGGLRFYERKEIKDMIAYLKLCQDLEKLDNLFSLDLPLLRVINEPKRKIGAKTLEKLSQEAAERNLPLIDVIADPKTISGAARKKLMDFSRMLAGLQGKMKELPIADMIDEILKHSGYRQMLEDKNDTERLDNIEELKNDFLNLEGETNQERLELYFQDISLYTDRQENNGARGVTLMTVHSAKGTEFDHVYLVNFNEGIFPTSRVLNQPGSKQAMEEERRLFYVAMTRARKQLTITSNSGYSFAARSEKVPSHFLNEIPDEYTNRPRNARKAKPRKVQNSGDSLTVVDEGQNKNIRFRKGDIVLHDVFGEGVVIALEEGYKIRVAFSYGIGIKVLNAAHPSVHHG